MVSFKGGIHPPTSKEMTKARPIEHIEEPQYVVIPMLQHIGAPCEPLVKRGDYVYMGQVVGDTDSYVSAPVHASVSGKVIDVAPALASGGDRVMSVVIENDYLDAAIPDKAQHIKNPDKMTPEEILAFTREAGPCRYGRRWVPNACQAENGHG